jgi:hypothetical protein
MRYSFLRDSHGGVAPLLALSIIPIMGAVAASVDYTRAGASKTSIQAALDSALLHAARSGDEKNWQQLATSAFNAVVSAKEADIQTVNFSKDASGNYTGQVTASVPMRMSGFIGKSELKVTAESAARPMGESDNSCLLTLDKKAALSHVSMVFNGAPNVSLDGCSLRSNTSLNCNGHSGGAKASWAAGTASGCSNPRSYVTPLTDIYEPLKTIIERLCGGLSGGATWKAGGTLSNVKTVSKGAYTEYHVCGDLTLEGEGSIIAGGSDSVVVIENGNLKLANSAKVSLSRTTIVLTGTWAATSAIEFPNGAGKKATLAVSPPTDPKNPFQGIAIYQDPDLTSGVDNDWGPGASLNIDGVIYLPNSNIEMRGVASSNTDKCTKIVSNTFRTNGAVSLDFSQVPDGCNRIGMKQWSDIPVHLVR